jgi:hypothetical protein
LPSVNGPRFAKAVTFEEFLAAGNEFIQQRVRNVASRQLLGRRYNEVDGNQEQLAVEAFEVLKSLDWFGVSELSDESLRRLARVLDVARPSEMPRLNQTYESAPAYGRKKVVRTTILRRERELIAVTNRADVLLYAWALKLFVSERVGSATIWQPELR